MTNRLTEFTKLLAQHKLDGFIVTNPVNIFYLTGFRGISPTEREAIVVIRSHLDKGTALTNATLITARLYQNEARRLNQAHPRDDQTHLRGEVKATSRRHLEGVTDLNHPGGEKTRLNIKIVDERHQIFTAIRSFFQNTKRVGLPTVVRHSRTKVGFEQFDLTFGEYQEFKKQIPASLIPIKDLIESIRAIKTADEIEKIEQAQIISQKAFDQLIKTLQAGQTEEEIANRLAQITKSLGGQGLAFESIVASGSHSGSPHHITSQKPIKKGDILLVDFGAKYQDYCADLTRTVFIGKATDRGRNIYRHVEKAQKAAIDKLKHGLKASEAYHTANNLFKNLKLEKHFTHSLGHGIGLAVHEKPHLRPLPSKSNKGQKDEILTEGMVFSVEPGLYFPWGGIRIEDLVTIQNDHTKILGSLPKDLIEIVP